ncbi:quinol dehydrogenase ferredoxin subunit NapH [Alisedimentitalea sp. MJ-SS2]|uniref:quinol dehydrogenase ferredoxin subunit NapH n=1 Tax=Aliisedimentitalea sp. MJ-SS2 TaxID=3049795 RepID=UPI002911C1F8|nr:quinol dehydrogenase ferredoxin subunit NapH [Alisedimentitalea sp. MJ-SS2]MDU8926771.1 quinol dehydrogenase ferredoxin subunit NapH [Alisedimentitalea sp. MJ-SS2]
MTVTPLRNLGKDAIEEKGWFKAHKFLILRRSTQIGTLALFLLGPWAGLYILKGNLASSLVFDFIPLTEPLLFIQMLAAGFTGLSSAVIIGAAIVAVFYFLVGGRVYCSWVCPVNIVTDAALWGRRKLDLKGSSKLKLSTRYWMLALTVALAAVTGTLAYELINPVSIIFRGLVFGMGLGWVVLIGIFAFDLLVAKRGWCGHLCPMGAFYSLLGARSLIRVRADGRDKCDDCMECYEVCPELQVIPPAVKSAPDGIPVILSGACTNCGRCIDICPHDVYAFGLRNRAFTAPHPLDAHNTNTSAETPQSEPTETEETKVA